MTREELTVAVEAHLHHLGRRLGRRPTRAEFALEVGFRSGAQDLSDFTGGRMPSGSYREARAHKLLEPAVERGAEELAAEIYAIVAQILAHRRGSERVCGEISAAVARHLYGLDGGGE